MITDIRSEGIIIKAGSGEVRLTDRQASYLYNFLKDWAWLNTCDCCNGLGYQPASGFDVLKCHCKTEEVERATIEQWVHEDEIYTLRRGI